MLEHGWFAAHLPGRGPVRLSDRALPALLGRGSLMLEFALLQPLQRRLGRWMEPSHA